MTGVTSLLFTHEPPYFLQEHYYALLTHAADINISDLTVQTDSPIFGLQYGQHKKLTTRCLSSNEVEDFINLLYGSNAVAKVLSGSDLDFSYTHRINSNQTLRFRINASLISQYEKLGIQISMRLLATTPPPIENLLLPNELINLSFIKEGIVLVCGATGSGKSTLLASMLALRAQKSIVGEKILTFEAPIEYILPIHTGNSITSQSELPRCLPDFAYAVRNALRRTPTAIMVGESRDNETISAVIEAALTGHSVFSTLHSQSVTQAINRLLMLFHEGAKTRIYYDFFSTTQAIIWQTLIPCKNGKRVALREYITIDPMLRAKLLSCSIDEVSTVINTEMDKNKTSLTHHATQLLQEDYISKETYDFYYQHGEI
ncbi:type IV pilus twitching motility protein PilT [Fastidiosibacter lacustris]|uniref:type IV pilus twitching motility protein PilT n=1 Tax=Fastidiosibacter lacustris TaxID=2056695 RepID=UPI000E348624|nr:ATPase, T2SS/T4P/T4SS family [Fastidiosibacter lacustris]